MSFAAASSSSFSGDSRGSYILNNHIILEAILVALPEIRDIIALSCVSRRIHYDVQHIVPLQARLLSFKESPKVADENVLALFERYLKDGKGSRPQKTMLRHGGTIVKRKGGAPGTAFTGSWRFLTILDLSGTSITTMAAKVLIAATCRGRVPGLCVPPKRAFAKEFPSRVFAGEYLLNNQGLRLRRLSIARCRGVQAAELVQFLKKIALGVTAKARRERQPSAPAPAPAAGGNNANPVNHPVNHHVNPLLLGLPHPTHPNNLGGNNTLVHVPEELQLLGLTEEDVAAIPSPMPRDAAELKDYGLPCSSLRRLDVEGIHGLDVKGETDAISVFKTVASLCTVTGLLGLDIDIQFCQGASCAYGIEEDHDGPEYISGHLEHHRDSYKRPLPHIPHERIIRTSSGRIFRIPRHCIPDVDPMTAYAPQDGGVSATIAHIAATYGLTPMVYQNTLGMVATHTIANFVTPAATQALPAILPPPALPAHTNHHPAVIHQPQAPDLRRTCMPSASEKGLRRRIAMPNGPRGLCEGCGRELWLCQTCNAFWVLYCGGCAAKTVRA